MLYKHKILEHPGEENIQFKMEITGIFDDALTRQANEAVRIKNCKKSEILNSKSQFNHPQSVEQWLIETKLRPTQTEKLPPTLQKSIELIKKFVPKGRL